LPLQKKTPQISTDHTGSPFGTANQDP